MELTDDKVFSDLKTAVDNQSKLHKAIEEDFEFALGKQWTDEDAEKNRKAGVLPLTINQIKPMIKIITGIERQSRSDYLAYPEGEEDELSAEIVTKLLKNVVKRSKAEKKLSEQFKEGVMGGLCYIEPYLDYTYDLLNGELKIRKINANRIFFDPSGDEYDLSDRRYVFKMTYDMTKDQLLELFPNDEKKIEEISATKVDIKDLDGFIKSIQTRDYTWNKSDELDGDNKEGLYDLTEYYYKSPKDMFYVADRSNGQVSEFETKDEAEQNITPTSILIKKKVPQIRLRQYIGNTMISDDVAWFYPKFKYFSIIPFFAELLTVNIKDQELSIQGIVRSLKDLQLELNKSRTLELKHLNSTANSGWMFPKNALDRSTKERFKKLGSSPGFVGEYDPEKTGGTVSPENFRITSTQMPAGHMAISQERINDIKQSSGINPDLLANDSQSQSGRAILLKQRQGLVMIQEMLDNYGETKKILGKFILSQLGEIFTVESAIRVLGDSFIKEHFARPQLDQEGNPLMDDRGELVLEPDMNEVVLIFNNILNNAELGKYDVSIGEGAFSETVRYTNFLTLMEMVEKGIPIPPEVIITESLLTEGQKQKIVAAIQAQQQVMAQAQGVQQ